MFICSLDKNMTIAKYPKYPHDRDFNGHVMLSQAGLLFIPKGTGYKKRKAKRLFNQWHKKQHKVKQ